MMRLRAVRSAAMVMGLLAASQALGATLSFKSGSNAVTVTAVTPAMFRVSVRLASVAGTPIQTTFIDPALTPSDAGAARAGVGGHQQLVTTSGVIDFDPSTGAISLLDVKNNVLIPAAPVGGPADATDKPHVELHLGWPPGKPFDVYASGNGSHTLVQHSARSHVGNGVAVEPFFWSPAGFACFAVGSDDNQPPQCDGKITNGALTWTAAGASADVYLIVAPTLADATRQACSRSPVKPHCRRNGRSATCRAGGAGRTRRTSTTRCSSSKPASCRSTRSSSTSSGTPRPRITVSLRRAKRVFPTSDWNPSLFPDPARQIQKFHDAGLHVVGIRKPAAGQQRRAEVHPRHGWGLVSAHESFDARGFLFANADASQWYAKKTEPLLKAGHRRLVGRRRRADLHGLLLLESHTADGARCGATERSAVGDRPRFLTRRRPRRRRRLDWRHPRQLDNAAKHAGRPARLGHQRHAVRRL